MALRPIPRDTDWPEEILELAREEFWATIDVIDPSTEKVGKYDPKTDSRPIITPAAVVIEHRAARVQHIRSGLDQGGSFEWGQKRPYRVQYEPRPDDPLITKGMVVRVRTTRRNPVILRYAFQVTGAPGSDHAAVGLIDTVSEYGVIGDE
ncbi:MAG: hypothetical protein K0Q52_113 [Microbacterium sp.]|jgi:hypothetical protein|nr:hypothetical protein [Microbacterium sp.]